MNRFHEDGINWGNFSIRKTLYNPDLHTNADQLSNMQPDRFFNLPIGELENRFNQQSQRNQHRSRYVYHPNRHSILVNIVHRLCREAGISMPSVVLFRTNKVGASTFPGTEIDVSSGARKQLSPNELEALLAHEVAHNVIHVKNLDPTNEETAADIMGARLSSETGMVNLIRYFAKHVNQPAAGDQEHDPDRKRIAKLKRTFSNYHRKEQQIMTLKKRIKNARSRNRMSHQRTEIHRLKYRLWTIKTANQKLAKRRLRH